jgi:hypothetical protein
VLCSPQCLKQRETNNAASANSKLLNKSCFIVCLLQELLAHLHLRRSGVRPRRRGPSCWSSGALLLVPQPSRSSNASFLG